MKNKSQENQSLFSEWENDKIHDQNTFIRDGIINIEFWKSTKIKILLLCKEAYTKGNGKFTMSEEISDSAPYRNWWSAARWVYGIRQILEEKNLHPNYPDLTWEEGNELLCGTAVVNLKKSNGIPNSNYSDIDFYFNNDKSRLKKQIDIINPDIVLCGRVFNYYRAIYESDNLSIIQDSEKCYFHGNRVIINFWHFANRIGKVPVFNELIQIINNPIIIERFK